MASATENNSLLAGRDVEQPRYPVPRWQGVAAPAPLRLSRSDTGGATFPDVREVLAD